MSNICRRCGHLIEYSIVPLSKIKNSHCPFCISEFNALVEKLDKEREERMAKLEAEFKEQLAELRRVAVELWSWSGLLQHLVDAANITTTNKVLVPVIANDLLLNLIPDGGRVSALVSSKWWFQRLRWTARVALLVPKDITKLNWQRRFDRILFVSARSKEVAEAQIISSIKLLADDAKLVVLVPASISAYLVANIAPITASRILETEAGDKFRILTYEV